MLNAASPPGPTLTRILALRLVAISLLVTTALLIFFVAKYGLDTPDLRRATLEEEVFDIGDAMRSGENPADWVWYRRYPASYGYRVFDHRTAQDRHVLSSANESLLPPLEAPAGAGETRGLAQFDLEQGLENRPDSDHWLLTERVQVGPRHYWIQVAMIGDPNWQWREAIANEIIDHVLVPVLFLVPALTLAMVVATRQALRPLGRIAALASSLGAAVAQGRPMRPLPEAGLPLEFHRVVSAMNAMLAKLERSLALQKQFTSDAAHELRTPLAVLRLELAELPQGPEAMRLRDEIDGLGQMVNQLLRFAQAEELVAAELHPVDLAEVARKVCEDLAASAVSRRRLIELDVPGPPVLVEGQLELLDVALRNLVDNALRYAPPDTAVEVVVTGEGGVQVCDRGPGVPDAQKLLVFDRFWRAERRRGSGAGIGLALVRRIVELHGGTVRITDRPGGGACFSVSLTRVAARIPA